MIKVKDWVDLEQLKYYGYKKSYNPLAGQVYIKDFHNEIKIVISIETREIYCFVTNFEIKPKLITFVQDLQRDNLIEERW